MIHTNSGSVLYIASAPGAPTALSGTGGYTTLTWEEVGEIEDLGEFGDESESVNFTTLKNTRVHKLKGPRDAGTMTIVCGDDMLDDGQIAMEAAEATPLDWPFKVVMNDAITLGGDNSEHYFFGKVMSKRRNAGNASNVVRRSFGVGINSEILSVDPS